MKVVGTERRADWPKLGPSIIIATALIVAIRTAKWVAKSSTDAQFSDVDLELDKEVSFAARISIRVMHELLRRHESSSRSAPSPSIRADRKKTARPSCVLQLAHCAARRLALSAAERSRYIRATGLQTARRCFLGP